MTVPFLSQEVTTAPCFCFVFVMFLSSISFMDALSDTTPKTLSPPTIEPGTFCLLGKKETPEKAENYWCKWRGANNGLFHTGLLVINDYFEL